jgi:hypothetical protein
MPQRTILSKSKLYMNDETFVSRWHNNSSPFYWFYEDENRINTASGIGHDITAVLDGMLTTH